MLKFPNLDKRELNEKELHAKSQRREDYAKKIKKTLRFPVQLPYFYKEIQTVLCDFASLRDFFIHSSSANQCSPKKWRIFDL